MNSLGSKDTILVNMEIKFLASKIVKELLALR